MRRLAAVGMPVLIFLAAGAGCTGQTKPPVRSSVDPQFFGPTTMKLSPVFTKAVDFDGDATLDGIEAVVELQDAFGDPTKAAGRIVFQIYRFKPYSPDPRGDRLAGPFEGRIDSTADQKARWSRVNRAYIFQLAFDDVRPDKDYVLEAMFESSTGKRFFDKLMIEGDHEKAAPASGPTPIGPTTATAPTTQESTTRAAASQPHEPPPRADQP